MIREVMLYAAHTLEAIVVEPKHIRMVVAHVSGASVHLAPIHLPGVGNDIQIVLRDVGGDIGV
jgi:hypothetical protein